MSNTAFDALLEHNFDTVASTARSDLQQRLKAVPVVNKMFFDGKQYASPIESDGKQRPLNSSHLEKVAVALVLQAVEHGSDGRFHDSVDSTAARNTLTSYATGSGSSAVALRHAIFDFVFPTSAIVINPLTKQLVNVRAFIRDQGGSKFMTNFVKQLHNKSFKTSTIARFEAGFKTDESSRLNHILYLIQRLHSKSDSDELAELFNSWNVGFSQVDVATFSPQLSYGWFQAEVNAAAQKHTSRKVPNPIDGGNTYHYCGAALKEFISANGGNMFTGKNANTNGQCGGSCFVASTPILLADGTARPISEIKPGDRVLTADGTETLCVDEEYKSALPTPALLFGINDTEPFFTDAHVFQTTEGPKAIDPSVAQEWIPGTTVGRLQVGDTVLRVTSTDPFAIEEVEITALTSRLEERETSVYALIVEGPQSYVANGFVVAATYPDLSEERFVAGLESLGAKQLAALSDIMGPAMPLLMHVLSGYAGDRLTEALTHSPQPTGSQGGTDQ